MKKVIISILLITVAAMLALGACANNAPAAEPTKEPSSEATETPAGNNDTDPTEAPADPTEEPATEAPVEETEAPTDTPAPTADASIEKGTNVALTAYVDIFDVSSTTGDTHVQWGWSYEFINDGIRWDASDPPSLGWTTDVGVNMDDPEQEEWIIFELEKYTLIDTVNVCPTIGGTCFPVDFHIEVSLDGNTYTRVATVEGCDRAAKGSDKPVVMTFDAVTAKYVKFIATRIYDVPSGNDGLLMQIGEIEIIAG